MSSNNRCLAGGIIVDIKSEVHCVTLQLYDTKGNAGDY